MKNMNRPYDINHHYYMYDIGWLIDKIQEVSDELDQAIDLRTIHYADPINWDITTQYQANTVVVDNKTGVAYISSQNVPAGVLLTNTIYWNPIFNYNDAINKLMSTIAYNEEDSPTATAAHAKNSFIYSNAVLYQAVRDIAEGDALKAGANIQLVTLSDSIIALINDTLTDALNAVSIEAGARAEADNKLSQDIAAEAGARAGADNKLSEDIAAEAERRKNADANYIGENKVSTVTGDDTRTAGNITDTADNIVIHGKKSILIDSDGAYTLNVGGPCTEVYDVNKNDSVKGTHTINRNNITMTITGKTNITAKDIAVSAEAVSINNTTPSLPIVFPDKTIDLHELDNIGSNKRVIIAMGDSLGAGITAPNVRSTYGWLYQLRDRTNKNLTVYTNLDIVIEGNSGFASTAPFLTQIKHIISNNNINPADVTDIIIFSGTNDCEYIDSTLGGALDEFFTYVKTTFSKNINLMLGTLIANYSIAKIGTANSLMHMYRSYAEKYGYNYTPDLFNLCLRKKYIQPDNTHLNDEGYKTIYPYIIECALKGATEYSYSSENIYANNFKTFFSVDSKGIGIIIGTSEATALYIGNVQINSKDTLILSPPITENIINPFPYTRVKSVLVNINNVFQMGDYYFLQNNEMHLNLSSSAPNNYGVAILLSGGTLEYIPTSALQY